MSKDTPLSTNEHNFIRAALSSGLRLDGRGLSDVRGIGIEYPGSSGSVQIRLGGTRVLTVITADLIQPFTDRPNEGVLNIYVNYSPMASPTFEAGYQGEVGVAIARIIDRGLRESRAIDMESLCVLAGEKVWSIRVDVHVLDHEGNLLDAINLAVLLGLLHFRRPDVTVVGESVTVHSVDDRQPIALALHHIPVASTFAFFDPIAESTSIGSNAAQPYYIIDPSLKEEAVADGTLTVILNVHGELCCLQKSGGLGVESSIILQCTQIALSKTQELTALIHQSLRDEAAKHNTGNAVRGSQPVYHAPVKPIDAFGVNVTKPAGKHVVAGKPIEVNMATKDESDEEEEETKQQPEDDDDDDADMGASDNEDDDGSDDGSDDGDSDAAAEFAQVAKKLQSNNSSKPVGQRKK